MRAESMWVPTFVQTCLEISCWIRLSFCCLFWYWIHEGHDDIISTISESILIQCIQFLACNWVNTIPRSLSCNFGLIDCCIDLGITTRGPIDIMPLTTASSLRLLKKGLASVIAGERVVGQPLIKLSSSLSRLVFPWAFSLKLEEAL